MESKFNQDHEVKTHDWLCDFLSTVMDKDHPMEIPRDLNTPWESLDLDSLAMIEAATAIEDHFEIEVDDEDLGEFVTIGDISTYIDKKISEKS